MRVPLWLERAGRVFWNGRDRRGHYDNLDPVAQARFKGEPPPACPHACCKGRRPHPPNLRVMKWKDSAPYKGRDKAAPSSKAGRAERAKDRQYRYDSYLDAQYSAAADATNGFMVNAAGRARGISSDSFFRAGRRASVERWGTDEMRAWWGSQNVASTGSSGALMTKTEYDRQHRRAINDKPAKTRRSRRPTRRAA